MLAMVGAYSYFSRREVARAIWVALIVLLLAALGWLYIRHVRQAALVRAQQELLHRQAAELLAALVPGGVANREKAAGVILPALAAYFQDHGEYPPYLFGGAAQVYSAFELYGNRHLMANRDPLIAGGYLAEYPLVWVERMPLSINESADAPCRHIAADDDTRDSRHWKCMFSTPDDVAYLTDLKDESLPNGVPTLAELKSRPLTQRRQFALGAKRLGDYYTMNLFAGSKDHKQFDYLGSDLPYFGYQRGEWLGGSQKECWLWFYGHTRWAAGYDPLPTHIVGVRRMLQDPAFEVRWAQGLNVFPTNQGGLLPLTGLDLLNADTAELLPDGTPDYICLLYKLRDGQVAEVVRAPDM
jgi:hypothetical protein